MQSLWAPSRCVPESLDLPRNWAALPWQMWWGASCCPPNSLVSCWFQLPAWSRRGQWQVSLWAGAGEHQGSLALRNHRAELSVRQLVGLHQGTEVSCPLDLCARKGLWLQLSLPFRYSSKGLPNTRWSSEGWQVKCSPFNLFLLVTGPKASWADLLPSALMCPVTARAGVQGTVLKSSLDLSLLDLYHWEMPFILFLHCYHVSLCSHLHNPLHLIL